MLDADTAFSADVGEEVLGETVGAMQSFFFGQPPESAPFERDAASSSYIPVHAGRCYFAGGLFGGSFIGFVRLMQTTSWLAEWDLAALGHTAPHDDESYLNSAFLLEPPAVSLGGHYIYPEPPADRAWGLRSIAWSAAFPPRILNLGARKWFQGASHSDRDYRTGGDTIKPLELLSAVEWPRVTVSASPAPARGSPVPSPTPSPAAPQPVAVAVCAPLAGTARQRAAWVHSLTKSVHLWHAHDAEIVIVDTGPPPSQAAETDDAPSPSTAASYTRFAAAGGRGSSFGGAASCPLPALQLLLSQVQARTVLLLDTASLLTWQANLPFLHSLADPELELVGNRSSGDGHSDGNDAAKIIGDAAPPTIVLACPRLASGAQQQQLGAAPASTGYESRCLSPAGAALRGRLGLPPHNCSPCDSMQPTRLARERLGEAPLIVRMTPMRKLTCWRLPYLDADSRPLHHHHGLSVLLTSLARELVDAAALAEGIARGDAAAGLRCGVDCWLGRGYAARHLRTRLPPLRFLSCIPDMRPLLRLDAPPELP